LAGQIRARLPTRETLMAHPWLQPITERLLEPNLWRLHHESVARGVAVGMFWAFVIPVGQIVVAAVHCTWWRANIPVAAATTMLTNPLTIGFWLWLAYHLGVLVLGEPLMPAAPENMAALGWLEKFGWPTALGMGLFAVGGSAVGYFAVKLVWRLRILIRRQSRARKSPTENSRA
jgi:uncharacterized protein